MSVDLATIGIAYDTSGLVKGTAALKENERQAGRTADAVDNTGRAAKRAGDAFSSFSNVLGGIGLGLALREFARYSDQYTKYTAQLKLATQSTAEYARANAEVQRIAKQTEGGLATVGVLYARITNATRELGTTQAQVSKISETIGLSLKVAGATAAESSSAMLQLSQAFGAGALRGEEFNAVNEAAPGLLRILAESMGVTQGALKKLAEDGKLTTGVLTKAFTDERVLAGLREQATQVRTISGAITLLKDQITLFIGGQNEATGAGAALANIIGVVARNLDLLTAGALGFAAFKIAETFAGIGAKALGAVTSLSTYIATQKAQAAATLAAAQADAVARQATLADAQAKAVATQATLSRLAASNAALVVSREETAAQLASANASAVSATAQINAARSAGALSFALATLRQGEIALTAAMAARSAATAELAVLGQQQARVSAAIAAANAAQTASTTALAAAQAGLTAATAAGAATTGLAARALGLIGGPIGAVATVLGLGVSAWLAWGGSAKKQSEDATSSVTSEAVGLIASLDEQIRKLKERNALATGGVNGFDVSANQEKILQLQARAAQLARETGKTEVEEIVRKRQLQTTLEELAPALVKQNTILEEQAIAQKRANAEGVKNQYAKYATDAEKLAKALDEARIAAGGIIPPDLEKRIRASFNKGAVKDFNKELSDQAKLLAELAGLSPDYLKDLRDLEAVRKKGNRTEAEYIALVEALIAKQPSSIALAKEQADADKERAQALESLFEANRKVAAEYEKSAETLAEQNAALRNEIELIGLTERQQLNVIRLRTEATIAVKELELAELQRASSLSGTQTRIEIALEEEIRLLRERNELQGAKVDRTEAAKTYEGLVSEGKRFTDDLERGLTDSLFRAFESGKGFFSTLWGGIKNLFKTTVLKLAIQGVVGGVTGGVSSAVNAATGGSSALGTISNLAGLTGLGTAFGSSFAAGFGATVSGGIGTLGLAIEGGLASIGTATGAGIASGLGQIAGALGPYALAAVAIYALVKAFDSKGGPKTESTFDTGYASLDRAGSDPTTAREISNSIELAYQQISANLGIAAKEFQVGVFTSIDTIGDAMTQLQVVARQNGMEIYNRGARLGGDGTGSTPGGIENVGRSEEELQAAVAAEVQQVLLAALRNSDLPAKFKDYLNAATDLTSAVQVLSAVKSLDSALVQLGGGFERLTGLSVDAVLAFSERFGGLEGLGATLGSYYENFYTEQERTAKATQAITAEFAKLGQDLPASRDALRELIEGALNSGNNGLAAGLLGLSGAFAQLVPAAESATGAIQDNSQAQAEAARLAEQIAQERLGLEQELLQLQGDTVELRARELASLDPSNRALQEQIFALQDLQTATEAATEASREAAAEAQRVAQEREGLERRILELTGDTQAIRKLELAGLDATNRALLQNIFALQDQATANQEAAQQAQAAADAQRQIAQERDGLERQLLQLQGDTAALRALERGALAESNRALYDQIEALQSQRAAADAAALALRDAAEAELAILREREGLEGRLLQLQGDTVALRQRELAALDPANQALLQQIFALEDQKAAADAAAQSASEAAASQAAAAAEFERQAQEALALQRQVAQERLGLEGRILELQGNTAALRERELAALDPANRDLQLHIYALEAEATAAQAAAQAIEEAQARAREIMQERLGLEGRLLELQGNTAEIRRRELQALDPSNRALLEQIYALQDYTKAQQDATQRTSDAEDALRNAYRTQAGELQAVIDKQREYAKVIRDYRMGLDTSANALLSPEAAYGAARQALEASAPEDFTRLADAFLEASRGFNASSATYFSDLELVKTLAQNAEIGALATADVSQLQLDAVTRQVAELITINESVLSVEQAISNLQVARSPAPQFVATGFAPQQTNGTELQQLQATMVSVGQMMQAMQTRLIELTEEANNQRAEQLTTERNAVQEAVS
jgi:tape measure domain-containing protein